MTNHAIGRREIGDRPGVESEEQKKSIAPQSGNVSASEVRASNNTALVKAQSTVDVHFPAPTFEPHPIGDFREDLQFYPHTDSYVAIDPLVRFRDKGWTPDLQKDLRDNLTKSILSSGSEPRFGTNDSQWEDARTTLEMARKANQLHSFVADLNKDIQAKSPGTDIKVDVESYSHVVGARFGVGGTREYDLDITVNGKVKKSTYKPGDLSLESISDKENQHDYIGPEIKINSRIIRDQ